MTASRTGPLLLPNLGGEEGGDWRRVLREPRVAAAAQLWRLLFAEGAHFPNDCLPETSPSSLFRQPVAAAFDWLPPAGSCVPWLSSAAAHSDPAAGGLPVHGGDPEVVARVHDKAFAQRTAAHLGLVPRPLHGTITVLEPEALGEPAALIERIAAEVARWPDWTRGHFTL